MKTLSTVLALLASCAMAGRLGIQLENDFPWHDDSDYTHGTRIEYELDGGWRFGVQQQIYTPYDISNPDQVPGRHPYAGTLLGFVGKRWSGEIAPRLTLSHDAELMMGILGPSSHADDIQKFIHKVLGCKYPAGWEHQLHDEFEIELSYWPGLDWRVLGSEFGWSLHLSGETGGLFGTLQDAFGINGEIKVGYGFGSSENDGEMRVRAVQRPEWAMYVLGGAEGRWWLRNELLEGNAKYVHNYDTITVDMEPLTGCLKAGFGVRYRQFDARLLWMWWSREYKTQERTPNYVSMTIGWEI